MKKLLLYLIIGFLSLGLAVAGGDDDKTKETNKSKASAAARLQLADINAQLSRMASASNSAILKPDFMQDLVAEVSAGAADDRSVAASLMGYLDTTPGQMKEDLQWDDLVILPVGLKKKVGDNATVTLGILKADFRPQYAELTVFIRLTTPVNSDNSTEKQRDLFFGIEGLRFTKQGGLSASNFKAVLLGDYLLPFKDWTVYLKGGIDKSVTPSENDALRTYIKFNCGEFQDLNVAAKIIIPRSKLLPCDQNGKKIDNESERVTIDNLRVNTTKGFRDLLFESNSMTPFVLPDHIEYAYFVNNLAFDLSDIANPSLNGAGLQFPMGYQGDIDEKWQGLYVQNFKIMLPEEFEEEDTGNRFSIEAHDIYWDRTGFSGYIAINDFPKKVNAKKWKLKVKRFELGFLQNKFKYGRFYGGIETPVHSANATDEELFSFDAEIFMGVPLDGGVGERSNYNLTVKASKNMPLDFMFAKGTIYEGSLIFLSLEYTSTTGYKFKPRAVLSGDMEIGVHTQQANQGTSYQAGKGVELGKVTFNKLVLQTEKPYVSIEEFGYEQGNNNFLVNFPLQITKFEKYAGYVDGQPIAPTDDKLYTTIGVELSLLKDKIGGSTEMVFVSEYNAAGKLRPKRVIVQDVMVRGDLPAVSFNGRVTVKENEIYKEVAGNLNVAIKKPSTFEVGVSVLFGRNKTPDYKYGFVDVYASFEGSTGVPLGPVNLYGAGIAVYWNMEVKSDACTDCYPADPNNGFLKYKKNTDVKFGIKLMAAIRDPASATGVSNGNSAFKARVYLDLAINDDWGIKHIGIYGNGVIAGNFMGGDDSNSQKTFSKNFAMKTGSNNASSANPSENTQKAKSINQELNSNESPNPVSGDPSSKIAFTAGILIDFERNIFDLSAEAYLKAGDLVGVGPYGKVGAIQVHFENSNTFIYIGKSPKAERIGVRYGNNVVIDAYLMLGKGVGAFPKPDPEVLNFFPTLKNSRRYKDPSSSAVSGSGFAFGASARVGINGGGKRWYASGIVIGGLDLVISNSSGCATTANTWYGQGQLYGLVKLDAGYKNKAGTKYVRLVSLGLGVYSYLNAPSPFGAELQACIEVPNWIPGPSTKCVGLTVGSICK